jgi:DNA-binding CsgD family transcriptional regulator
LPHAGGAVEWEEYRVGLSGGQTALAVDHGAFGGSMLNGVESKRSTQVAGRATRTIACIDVRAGGAERTDPCPTKVPLAMAATLLQIERTVRAGDRICPMSTCQVAVEFAPAASGVPPQVLGDRLARAIGSSMQLGNPRESLAVSVGVAAPAPHLGTADLTCKALSAARAGSLQLGRTPFAGTHACDTVVTVDQVLTPRSTSSGSSATGSTFESIHRRSTYRYQGGRIRRTPSLEPVRASPADPVRINLHETDLTVLIADPRVTATGGPSLAAVTAANMAEQLGCRTATVAVSIDDQPALAVDGVALDIVVLVLDGGWVGHTPTWSSSAWGILARLTSSWVAAGVPVTAVSAGAAAGAVASCVAHGATAVSSLDELPDALRALRSTEDPEGVAANETQFSARFHSLVGLTTSERRVLFYLTEGWAAQDITDQLVVSLTTVRSHIRSVLLKLGVRSQLAAVAIANSRDLGSDLAGDRS